ncbi:glucose-6-phosphate isomerase [Sciscionella sediminilitoris]|uniref:glucose-6-phosphate isomerase n=1 Tax=Sciscionella sediminilitoris TaxID=1445613 RepID=UPI0004DF14CC|nr:glucose-6-phosphate isomerase [Sciscionella sp. SE31]
MTEVQILDDTLAEQASQTAAQLAAERFASKLTSGDATLWGAEAQSEAAIRLAWTTLHETSRPLLAEIEALRAAYLDEGVSRFVLAGMGGSSLAPEVITQTAGVQLVVLDTTDPQQVADALAGELQRTAVIVSSKSGGTVETDSHRRIFEAAFTEQGIDAASRIVVVTDPGSPLQHLAEEAGYRKVFLADPHVGGRYSALTAFGLVPAGLAGADIAGLLDDAADAAKELSADAASNPALLLGAALGNAHSAGAEKVVLADNNSGITGFADWAEQLIAESTGKNGTGLLPVAVESPEAPGFADAGADATPVALGQPTGAAKLATAGSLGGLMLLWEYATAVAGKLLGINPFDQPDVEAAKQAARDLLGKPSGAGEEASPNFVVDEVEVYASGDWIGQARSLTEAIKALLDAAPEAGYLSVQAYLDRIDDASAAVLRGELAARSGLQTTFGWGPRFLHSTGQYHKGGHQNGVFLQITGANADDLDVPEQPFTLGGLQHAQALGDGSVLAAHERPVLRLHLTDRLAGLSAIAAAIGGLA